MSILRSEKLIAELPTDTQFGPLNVSVENFRRRRAKLLEQHRRAEELERSELPLAAEKDKQALAAALRADKSGPKEDVATATVRAAIDEARRQAAGLEAALEHDKCELAEIVEKNKRAWIAEAEKAEASALREYDAAIAALAEARSRYSKAVVDRYLLVNFPDQRYKPGPVKFLGRIGDGEPPLWAEVLAGLEQDCRREKPTRLRRMPRPAEPQVGMGAAA